LSGEALRALSTIPSTAALIILSFFMLPPRRSRNVHARISRCILASLSLVTERFELVELDRYNRRGRIELVDCLPIKLPLDRFHPARAKRPASTRRLAVIATARLLGEDGADGDLGHAEAIGNLCDGLTARKSVGHSLMTIIVGHSAFLALRSPRCHDRAAPSQAA
jgi:hypothetical protein